jgi:hypothetical protein
MYRKKPRDEEEQLKLQRDIVLRHKHDLELRIASYGPFDRPSYMLIQLEEFQAELRAFDRKIARVQRAKQTQTAVQQVAAARQAITKAVLPPPARGRRASRRSPNSGLLIVPFVVLAVILGVFAAVSSARPSLSGEFTQRGAAPLAAALLPEPTAILIPTIPPVQETAMAVSDWPPSNAERRVIGNTGGIGVRLRAEPFEDSHSFTGLQDGTSVYLIETKLDDTGSVWWWIALSDGSTGFVNEKYLLPSTP